VRLLNLEGAFEVRLIERLNRFVVLVERGGKLLRAHNTNTGRLKELLTKGKRAFCLPGGKRTDCRLFAVEEREGFALIDTSLQMRAFELAQQRGLISWLKPPHWRLKKRNFNLNGSLIDYLFEGEKGRLVLELKSAALRLPGDLAGYPDCPTERGRRHLRELARLGSEAGVLFVCALSGVKGFKPYCEGDPLLCEELKRAAKRGVSLRAIALSFDEQLKAITIENDNLPIHI